MNEPLRARIFRDREGQFIELPEGVELSGNEALISKIDGKIVLEPLPIGGTDEG